MSKPVKYMPYNKKPESRIVYSTQYGEMCPYCGKPKSECVCRQRKNEAIAKTDGIVRVRLDTKGRMGKDVTLVWGLPLNNKGLLKMAKQFKQKFGAGGTVKNNIIEIQGNRCDAITQELTGQGYKVKVVGKV